MSERVKLSFLSVLLILALGTVAITVANTFEAVHSFQQENSATKVGNVNTIRPWMTIRVISHIYHVPEDYLSYSLRVTKADSMYHATLYEIADHKHQPVDQIIRMLKQTILDYRREHSSSSLSLQLPWSCSNNQLAPMSGETKE